MGLDIDTIEAERRTLINSGRLLPVAEGGRDGGLIPARLAFGVEGWRSWRLQSEICFRFYRRTLKKVTGANGQGTETARHPSWRSWIENTERFCYPARGFFTAPS
jgi:hypothetical protein